MSITGEEAQERWESDEPTAILAARVISLQQFIEEIGHANTFDWFWDFAKAVVDERLANCELLDNHELDDFVPRRHPGAILPYQTVVERLDQIEQAVKERYCDMNTDEDAQADHRYEQRRDDELMK